MISASCAITFNFAPSQGRFKVYIIDEVHMLSTSAFNALLKTLEEPPSHVIFILATTEIHKIPATVLSRCQRHEFRRIPVQTIIEKLTLLCLQEHIEIEDEALSLVARQATGSLRDAISLIDQLSSWGRRSPWRRLKISWVRPPAKQCSTWAKRFRTAIARVGWRSFTLR